MQTTDQLVTIWVNKIGKLLRFVRIYAFECFLILLILLMCISRGLRVGVRIHDPAAAATESSIFGFSAMIPATSFNFIFSSFDWLLPVSNSESPPTALQQPAKSLAKNVSQTTPNSREAAKRTSATKEEATYAIATQVAAEEGNDHFNSVAVTDDPAPHINNLTLVLSPDYAERKKLPAAIVRAKKLRVQQYLDNFAPMAQAEMKQYGIPASIKLAQALLESNAGDSRLARQSNNHFGIKCRSKCLGCTCRNYGDDTRYDMFRVFNEVAESYREHSILLQGDRYKKLQQYDTDYKKWAHGLKSCGYATDANYAEKLIKIIENLQLYRYDGLK